MFPAKMTIGLLLVALTLVFAPESSHAQVNITQVQKLHFGKWFFGDNSSALSVTVTPAGTMTHSPNINMFTAPRPGIYNITGLPTFATINAINITPNAPITLGGQTFTIDNFTTQYTPVDEFGNTQLRVGADAVTSGDGQAYIGGVYDGTIDIEIDY